MSKLNFILIGGMPDQSREFFHTQGNSANEAISEFDEFLREQEEISDGEEFHPMMEPILEAVISSPLPISFTGENDDHEKGHSKFELDDLLEAHYIVANFVERFFEEYPSLRAKVGGTGGTWEIARDISFDFIARNKDREWNGEFIDEIQEFAESALRTIR